MFKSITVVVAVIVVAVIALIVGLSIKYAGGNSTAVPVSTPPTSVPVSTPLVISVPGSGNEPTNKPVPVPIPGNKENNTPAPDPLTYSKEPLLPVPVPSKVPLMGAKVGDYCEYDDTCESRVCGNTQQTDGTAYKNTCLGSDLPKGSVCYKDDSCSSYRCSYDWSFDRYLCN